MEKMRRCERDLGVVRPEVIFDSIERRMDSFSGRTFTRVEREKRRKHTSRRRIIREMIAVDAFLSSHSPSASAPRPAQWSSHTPSLGERESDWPLSPWPFQPAEGHELGWETTETQADHREIKMRVRHYN